MELCCACAVGFTHIDTAASGSCVGHSLMLTPSQTHPHSLTRTRQVQLPCAACVSHAGAPAVCPMQVQGPVLLLAVHLCGTLSLRAVSLPERPTEP